MPSHRAPGPPYRRRVRAAMSPSRPAVGAALLLAVVAVGLWGWRAGELVVAGAETASARVLAVDLLVAAAVGLLLATLIALVAALGRRRVPWLLGWSFASSALLLGTMGAGAAVRAWWALTLIVLLAVPLVGAFLGSLTARPRRPGLGRTVVAALAAAALLATGGVLAWPGGRPPATAEAAAGLASDPRDRGPYEVREIRYGSQPGAPGSGEALEGTDAPVDRLVTAPADASRIVTGWPQSLTRAWGFDAAALPVDATVWMPATEAGGQRRLPLVLLVHGQAHVPASREGLAYLGEHLASRGYVAASIDQGFLAPGVLGGDIRGLDAARSWLILEHLRRWRDWTEGGGTPFAGLVDLGRVSLVGHSRGGEAAATAAHLNTIESWPEAPDLPAATGSTVSTVIALAPSDALYRPGGRSTPLAAVNYLTLAGSSDADVLTFAGAAQYDRAEPAAGQVKAAVLLEGANHSQFNTRWGRHDAAVGAAAYALSTGSLMTPEEQQGLATAYVTAFLELTVRGETVHRSVFDAPSSSPWDPRVRTRQQFAAGGAIPLSVEGQAAEVLLPTRAGTRGTKVRWLTGQDTRLQLGNLSAALAVAPHRDARLHVDLADGTPAGAERPVLAPTLEATDASGRKAAVPFATDVPPPLQGQVTKLAVLMPAPSSEATLSTFSLPLSDLVAAGLDPTRLAEASIVLPETGSGGVFLDNAAVSPAP